MTQITSQSQNMVHCSSQAKLTENDLQTLPFHHTNPFYNIIPINIWIWNQTRSHHISPNSTVETAMKKKVSNGLLSAIIELAQSVPFKSPIAHPVFSYKSIRKNQP
jgi:hypothetical protein